MKVCSSGKFLGYGKYADDEDAIADSDDEGGANQLA